jgi:formylglycine-generating enzyme required for sulfatase activity
MHFYTGLLLIMSTLRIATITNSAGKVLLNNGYPYQPGQVIEYLTSPCNGGTMTGLSGTYTTANVTAAQGLNATYADVTGSSITYRPPPGTVRVMYRYTFSSYWETTAHSITHFKFFIDADEVTFARYCRSMQYYEYRTTFEWIIPIGGIADTTTGRQALWTNFKTLKVQARRYATGSNGQNLNGTTYWDGTSSNQFNQPQISIIAIA